MIPIVAKLNINKIPKINTRLLGNANLVIGSFVSSFLGNPKKYIKITDSKIKIAITPKVNCGSISFLMT